MAAGNDIGILPLHNRPYVYYAPSEAKGGYFGFGQRSRDNRDRKHKGVESVPAFMFFSRPAPPASSEYDRPDIYQTQDGFVGLSSFDVPSLEKVEDYEDIGISSTTINGDIHQDLDINLYGNENTGKFYAFLPLIKI